MMRISTLTRTAGTCIALLAGGQASGQQVTVAAGFAFQTWNAGTNVIENIWRPESFTASWNNGLRWTWQAQDGMGNIVPPEPVAVFDPAVPGITKAYQFPGATATAIGTNWENNATAGESATHEIWFKASDLVGTHVLLEFGAENKGVAFALDGSDLVTLVRATEGTGGAEYTHEHREPIQADVWYQAVIVISYADFVTQTYVNGSLVNTQSVPPALSYRWTGGNTAGLGTIGSDPAFPDVGIAGGTIPAAQFTDFDGMIAIQRFYDIDLFPDEILDNYEAITDAAATTRRSDFNEDGSVDDADQLALVQWFSNSTSDDASGVQFPFPSGPGGGVQTNDPALDERIQGDFIANRDGGFNPTGGQEPSFQFPSVNVLEPMTIRDPAFPSIRTAWNMNGLEGFRGPKFEQAEDSGSANVQMWMHFDDVSDNHCLFEAGGSGAGFSVVSIGDQLVAAINTRAEFNPATPMAEDEVTISSAPGVLTPGWHQVQVIVRRFNDVPSGIGTGFELYLDGVQVAAINDDPGPDMEFGTADDINNFDVVSNNNTNFIGGNQSGWCQVQGSAYLPAAATNLVPFNGMVGPIRVAQGAPLPDVVSANYAAESAQSVINARNDVDADGAATFLDVIAQLEIIDAGR